MVGSKEKSIRTIILLEFLLKLRNELVLLLLRLSHLLNPGLLLANGFVKLTVEQLGFLQDRKSKPRGLEIGNSF